MWYRPSASSWEPRAVSEPGKCLAVLNPSTSISPLVLTTCNGAVAQKWAFDSTGRLVPALLAPSKCVTFFGEDPNVETVAAINDCGAGTETIAAASVTLSRFLWYPRTCKCAACLLWLHATTSHILFHLAGFCNGLRCGAYESFGYGIS